MSMDKSHATWQHVEICSVQKIPKNDMQKSMVRKKEFHAVAVVVGFCARKPKNRTWCWPLGMCNEEPHRTTIPPLFVPLQFKEIIPQSQSLRDSVTKTTGFTYLGVKESNLYILLPIMCSNGPVLMDMICSTLLLPTMILNQWNKPAWCILGLQ